MVGIENYYAHIVVLLSLIIIAVDRFWLRRALVSILSTKDHGIAGGLIRFSLDYTLANVPLWSKVTYRLVDKNNPSTVIHGRSKPLEINGAGRHSEYLFLSAATLATGEWNLYIQVETVASRFNPFYRLFPCVSSYSKQIEITCNNAPRPAPVSKEVQPNGAIAPSEIACADPVGRRALVEVFIAKSGAILGKKRGSDQFVIGSWDMDGVELGDIEFRVNRFFSMGSGAHERKAVGEAVDDWKGFDVDSDEVFLMSCFTDYVAFGWLSGVSTGTLELKQKGVEGVACSSQLTITCG